MEPDLLSDLTEIYAGVIIEHRVWLQQFNRQRLKKWVNLLEADPEAAICEAMTRKLLSDNNIDVQPYEDLAKGGPDFLCSKNDESFYVETTCISIEAATKKNGLCPTDNPDVDDTGYYNMTEKFRSEITRKTKQCSTVKGPRIIATATLHPKASVCCIDECAAEELLTGTTYITGKINTITGQKLGKTYETTRLEGSVFIKPKKNSPNQIRDARNSVSAVLLCGFGTKPPNVIGCLHHNANYSFDRTLLPCIKFCRLKNGSLSVGWV